MVGKSAASTLSDIDTAKTAIDCTAANAIDFMSIQTCYYFVVAYDRLSLNSRPKHFTADNAGNSCARFSNLSRKAGNPRANK